LFLHHLEMTGEDSPTVQLHAREAFENSVGLALLAAASVAVVAAILLSWFLARRVSRPISSLAAAAESVAHGNYEVAVPETGLGTELHTLSSAFQDMANSLATTDDARTQLLSDLSHEIRTPLATLEAHIDGLEDGVVAPSAETFDVMRSEVRRLLRLASDVRLTAQAQEHALDLRLQPVAVGNLVNTACALHEPMYHDKGVELRNACGHSTHMVAADPDRMQQVLANLLDNALRHTPAGGQVQVGCEQRASLTEITVADTGDGLAASDLERIFNRFQRLDGARTTDNAGSGLGLTIARALVQDQGGDLFAVSEGPGYGSTFTIRIPTAR
jgi:signal transduction histidine kinase